MSLAVMAACSSDDDANDTPTTPDIAVTDTASFKALLCADEANWAMEFFPSDGKYGGFAYGSHFTPTEVTLTSELLYDPMLGTVYQWGTTAASSYSVLSDSSIVLAFDDYNGPLHFFSRPRGNIDPDGYESDSLFTFQRVSNARDSLFFRGKQHGREMVLVKQSQAPATYMQQVLTQSNQIAQYNYRDLVIGDKHYLIHIGDQQFPLNGNNFKMPVYPDNKQLTVYGADTITMPYIYNDRGFRLYQPISIDGHVLQQFVYNEHAQTYSTPDGSATIAVPSLIDQLRYPRLPWFFQANNVDHWMSASLYNEYVKADNWFIPYAFGFAYFTPTDNPTDQKAGIPMTLDFRWYSKSYREMWNLTRYGMTFKPEGETSNGSLIVALDDLGPAYSYSMEEFINPFIQALLANSPYRVVFDDGPLKTEALFVSQADPSVWFKLRLGHFELLFGSVNNLSDE